MSAFYFIYVHVPLEYLVTAVHPLEALNVEGDEKLEQTLACKIHQVHWSVGEASALDLFHYLKTLNAGSFNSHSAFKPLRSSK